MSDWFAQPNITNYTGMVDYANTVTNNYFGLAIPIMVFIVVFVATGNVNMTRKLLISSFIAFVNSILIRLIGWVDNYIVIIFIVILGASGFMYYWTEKRG